MMMNYEKNRLEKTKRLHLMALALLVLALLASLGAFLFLPFHQAEAFYMVSLVFLAMSAVCRFGTPTKNK